jgi:hypothetical protein
MVTLYPSQEYHDWRCTANAHAVATVTREANITRATTELWTCRILKHDRTNLPSLVHRGINIY